MMTYSRQGVGLLHTWAITRDIPNSFVHALSHYYDNTNDDDKNNNNDEGTVQLERARQQHASHVETLRHKCGMATLVLPPLEKFPDSCFIEDALIVASSSPFTPHGPKTKLLFTSPGHETRRGEGKALRDELSNILVGNMRQPDDPSNAPSHEIWDMAQLDPTARCDGGDVLNTGRHVFVGISGTRTNESALAILKQFFAPLPVLGVDLLPAVSLSNASNKNDPSSTPDILHLKSVVTHLDEFTLLSPAHPSSPGFHVVQTMQATALGYDIVRVPDPLACNSVVVVHPQQTLKETRSTTGTTTTVLIQDTKCLESRQILEQAVLIDLNQKQHQRPQAADMKTATKFELQWMDTSEVAKKDGALTCCSVLL
ncbi:hypothetical protein ACA910_015561 [Epithemia clementina (nom. ined.)]